MEWLQEEDVYPASPPAPHPEPTARFDWRRRAASRSPPSHTLAGRRYIKRIQPPHVSTQMGEPFYEEIQSYQKRFLALLAAEQAEDEAVLKERLSNWSLDRLREEGYCLTGLSAFWLQATQFGRPVAAFLLGPGLALPDHQFENGIQVLVSHLDPLKEPPLHGSVVARTTTQVKVSFPESFDLEDGPWRLDIGRSNVIYERMRTAISHLNRDPLSLEQDAGYGDRQLILQGTHLRDVLLRTFASKMPGERGGAFKDDMRIQSWARRYAEVRPVRVEGDPPLSGLNETQVRAVAMMIGERISLVQGPPGTGKTKTIIEAVKLLKDHFEVACPLLVCTYTNVAVDNLVEGLAVAGVQPLRVGHGGKVKSRLVEHTLDFKLENHPLRREVNELSGEDERLQKRMDDLQKRVDGVCKGERRDKMQMGLISMERHHKAVKGKLYGVRQQMLQEIVGKADVICTTCITSACVALNVTDFPVVFVDEASMCTEPASLIPLMKGSRHVALVGDHKQLPPIIGSREAQAMGLGISLFERLIEEGYVQYRMHPSISRFPSSEFYQFSLQDGTVDADGNISPGLLPPASRHLRVDCETGDRPSIVFLDHAGSESVKDRSRVNLTEAYIVCGVVEDLLLKNERLGGEEIGIIAPYAAQIALVSRLLKTDATYRHRFKEVLGDHRAMQVANIEIKTVDGFEGREKEVIVFSTVRNNGGGHIGFLGDKRRLNVGLTRARRGLFVVGSLATLRGGGESWGRYARYLVAEGLVVDASDGGPRYPRQQRGTAVPRSGST